MTDTIDKKNPSIYDLLQSDEFRKFVRDELIEYKEVNGFTTIDEKYISQIVNHDSLDFAEKYLQSIGVDSKSAATGISLVDMWVHSIIKQEIANLTSDVSFGGRLSQYINCLELNGFRKISQIDYQIGEDDELREESEMFYWHDKYAMLVHVETYFKESDGLNSIKLIANGSYKDGVKRSDCHSNVIDCTNFRKIEMDLRELPSRKIANILSDFNLEKTWKEFCYIPFHSYLSHERKSGSSIISDDVWVNECHRKVSMFPDDVKEALFKDLSVVSSKNEIKVVNAIGLSKDYFKVLEFVKTITDEEIREIKLNDHLFDIRYSSNFEKALIPSVRQRMEDLGIQNASNFCSEIYNVVRKADLDLSKEDLNKLAIEKMATLSQEDLKLVAKRMEYQSKYFKEYKEILDIANSLIVTKSRKHKLS